MHQNLTVKERPMNAHLSHYQRELSCGVAAALITVALSAAFVQSTALAPGGRPYSLRPVSLPATHGWFGQPEPAILVD